MLLSTSGYFNRRNVALLAATLLLTLILHYRTTSLPLPTLPTLSGHLLPTSYSQQTSQTSHTSHSSSSSTCDFQNSTPDLHRVKAPPPSDTTVMRLYWKALKALFDNNAPSHKVPWVDPWKFEKDEHGYPSPDDIHSLINSTDDQARVSREAHRAVLQDLPSYPENVFAGKGVVILAGARYSEFAATTLRVLRDLGSQLPVEVWSKDETEERAGWCEELEAQGMACRRLVDYMDMSALEHPYQWKIFTILFSRFEHVLFLDADAFPLKAPDDVFESELFLEKGAVVWPDYWLHTGSPRLRYVIGESDEHDDRTWLLRNQTVDSGQILWNKQTRWRSLLLATYYNYFGPSYYYSLINNGWSGWGDKDTFPTALIAAHEDYYQVPQGVQTLFISGTVHGIAMVHTDPRTQAPLKDGWSADPFIMHANSIKWSMHEIMGASCDSNVQDLHCIPGTTRKSYYEDTGSDIYQHLIQNKRIFSPDSFEYIGIDPEPYIWRAVEHAACRSKAWGDDLACGRTRTYMTKTFGFKFDGCGITLPGQGDVFNAR